MQRVADLAARPSHTANEPHPDHVPLNDIKNHLHIPTRRRRPALGMHTFGRLIAADANSSTPTATTARTTTLIHVEPRIIINFTRSTTSTMSSISRPRFLIKLA